MRQHSDQLLLSEQSALSTGLSSWHSTIFTPVTAQPLHSHSTTLPAPFFSAPHAHIGRTQRTHIAQHFHPVMQHAAEQSAREQRGQSGEWCCIRDQGVHTHTLSQLKLSDTCLCLSGDWTSTFSYQPDMIPPHFPRRKREYCNTQQRET